MTDIADEQAPQLDGSFLYSSRRLGIAEVQNVCLVVWAGPVTPSAFERQRQALQEVVTNHPRGAGFLCVIEAHAPPPEEHMRKASIQMVEQHGQRLRAVACVIEGSGFRAAATRSVLSSMALIVARRSELTFEASVTSAASWLARRCGASASQLELADRELRNMMSAATTVY